MVKINNIKFDLNLKKNYFWYEINVDKIKIYLLYIDENVLNYNEKLIQLLEDKFGINK